MHRTYDLGFYIRMKLKCLSFPLFITVTVLLHSHPPPPKHLRLPPPPPPTLQNTLHTLGNNKYLMMESQVVSIYCYLFQLFFNYSHVVSLLYHCFDVAASHMSTDITRGRTPPPPHPTPHTPHMSTDITRVKMNIPGLFWSRLIEKT